MNIFRKRKQEVEEIIPQPANDEIQTEETPAAPPDQQEKPVQLSDEDLTALEEELDKEIDEGFPALSAPKYDSTVSVLSRHSRRYRTQKDPREYQAYETATSPKWLDIQFANGRRVLISHFDVKRVDSMTSKVVSIFCSDCVIRLEGKNLLKLIDDDTFERIRRITMFNDKEFDAPGDDEVVVEMIELKEI